MAKLTDYAGAGARLDVAKALALDPRRWGFQRKIDGTYVRIGTDDRGCIATMVHRSGEAVSVADADGLYGLPIGIPSAALHGELTAHTEAGIAERQRLGYAAVHLFDVSEAGGRRFSTRPYADRHALLQRWQAGAENLGDVPRLDWWTSDERNAAHDPVTGRFVRAVPRDLRRLPIVALVRGKGAAETLWAEHVERDGGEGIVAVRLDAPLDARGSKRKVKAALDLECVVVSTGNRAATLLHDGHMFVVSAVGKELRTHDVVTVLADGFYADGRTPRFPRIQRTRRDLAVSDYVN